MPSPMTSAPTCPGRGLGCTPPKGRHPLQTGELAAGIRGTSKGTEGQISSDAPYSSYVEYGTQPGQGPRPFMRPGVVRGVRTHLQPKLAKAKAITDAERRKR